jgi:hypothetical protein
LWKTYFEIPGNIKEISFKLDFKHKIKGKFVCLLCIFVIFLFNLVNFKNSILTHGYATRDNTVLIAHSMKFNSFLYKKTNKYDLFIHRYQVQAKSNRACNVTIVAQVNACKWFHVNDHTSAENIKLPLDYK